MALDAAQNIVSCAAAARFAPAQHALGDQAWWGMLATAPKHRGHRLSLILGAHAMLEMRQRFGISSFMTGVEPGNGPSEAVCTRLGLAHGPYSVIGCADPVSLGASRMTK